MEAGRISLREADAEDSLAIAKLHAMSWQTTYRGLLPDAYLDEEVERERIAYWSARMSTPTDADRLALIAECNGDAAGFVFAERKPGSRDGVLLDNLHVSKHYQGRGVGKLLMNAVEEWARNLGESRLYLFVLEGNNRAMTFYEQQGWQFAGSESDEMAGIPVTARRYVRSIAAA
ncbi:N-acetyltransferase family protein [Trinickia sp. EG282A]|uniref:N-acetyltransferase family protein n=1 Tax=Trinickia sp. EG282A TaxID=3237013 RepID=UPI0034D1526D